MARHKTANKIEDVFKVRETKRTDDPIDQAIMYRLTRPRIFRYRISSIAVNAEDKIAPCFLYFEVGGVLKEVETAETIKKVVKKKYRENKDAPEVEVETEKEIPRKEIHVVKPVVGKFYTMSKICESKKDVKYEGVFEGFWTGSYRDLKRQFLTVQVWQLNWFDANQLMGSKKILMKDLAEGNVNNDVDIFGKSRAMVCRTMFKFEFEEVYDFRLEFTDWQVVGMDASIRPRVEVSTQKYMRPILAAVDSFIDFFQDWPFKGYTPAIMSPLAVILPNEDVPKIEKSWSYLAPRHHRIAVQMVDTGDGKRRNPPLHYHGTRSDLEDEILYISVNERVNPMAPRRRTFETFTPLQGILDYGNLTAPLTGSTMETGCFFCDPVQKNDGICTTCCKYTCRGLFCLCLLCSSRQQTVVKDSVTYEARGSVTFFRNTKPMYRQFGKSGGDTLKVSLEGENYIKVKIFSAKNLRPAEGVYLDTVNPSISAEWNGQTRETRIIFDTSSPTWAEVLDFRVLELENIPTQLTFQCWHNDGFSKTSLGLHTIDLSKLARGLIDAQTEEMPAGALPPKLFKLDVMLESGIKPSAGAPLTIQIYMDPLVHQFLSSASDQGSAEEVVDVKGSDFKNAFKAWQHASRHVRRKNDGRFFIAYGRDERTQKLNYLPCFLTPSSPPHDLMNEPTDNGSHTKRDTDDAMESVFHFVYSIECIKKDVDDQKERLVKDAEFDYEPAQSVWADPFHFLTKLRGDYKDHAILLCNYFLGMGLNAFICVGRAKLRPSDPPCDQPHVWVMTLEISNINEFQNIHRVIFWELSDGKIYPLDEVFEYLPSPEEPDESAMSGAERKRRNREKAEKEKEKAKREQERKERREAGLTNEMDTKQVYPDEKPSLNFFDEEVLDLDEDDVLTDLKASKHASRLTRPLVNPSLMRARRSMVDTPSLVPIANPDALPKVDADGNPIGGATVAALPGKKDESINDIERFDMLSAVARASGSAPDSFSVFDAKQMSEQQMKMAFLIAEKKRIESLRLRFGSNHQRDPTAKMFIMMPDQDNPRVGPNGEALPKLVPYATIDVVFNHKMLYANLQHPDPTSVVYDFTDPSRWCAFPYEGNIKPFYSIKSVRPSATPREIRIKQQEILDTLRTALEKVRAVEYNFYTHFFDMTDEIERRLQMEEEYGFVKRVHSEKYKGFEQARNLWNERIRNQLPDGCQYRERLFYFKHADASRIAEAIVAKCRSPELLGIDDFLNPWFAIGVKVSRLPASVVPTRVLLSVVSYNPQAVVR